MSIDIWDQLLLRDFYEIYSWRAANAVIQAEHPEELQHIVEVLKTFRLRRSHLLTPGGGKSLIAESLDGQFYMRGWGEQKFDIEIKIDGMAVALPTHKVDCYRNKVALEVEWNNKSEFYDRDLNNFRILFENHAVSVGVIITRSTGLQKLLNQLGRGASYGASTTHMNRLLPRIQGGGAGGCPVLAIGIKETLYVED